METLKYKTNISCSGCVRIVTPFLTQDSISEWEVDTVSPEKILTAKVQRDGKSILEAALTRAGFKFERLES